ncbi:NADH dehydrogenase (ubiquinone) 1 beta subcomplex 9 [Ilyonectria robusta]
MARPGPLYSLTLRGQPQCHEPETAEGGIISATGRRVWTDRDIQALLTETEKLLDSWKHPDPYTPPTAPGGKSWECRSAVCCQLLRMTQQVRNSSATCHRLSWTPPRMLSTDIDDEELDGIDGANLVHSGLEWIHGRISQQLKHSLPRASEPGSFIAKMSHNIGALRWA